MPAGVSAAWPAAAQQWVQPRLRQYSRSTGAHAAAVQRHSSTCSSIAAVQQGLQQYGRGHSSAYNSASSRMATLQQRAQQHGMATAEPAAAWQRQVS